MHQVPEDSQHTHTRTHARTHTHKRASVRSGEREYPFMHSIQTNTGTFANSVDPDETARDEPSHLDLHYLPYVIDFLLKCLFATTDVSKFRDGRVHIRNSRGWGETVKMV